MKKSKLTALILVFVLILSAVVGCGNEQNKVPPTNNEGNKNEENSQNESNSPDGVKTGGTVIIGQSAEPITLNPNGKMDNNFDAIAQNIFSRLLKTNNVQKVILDLATDYTVSADGQEYTFKLPANVTFHDGEKMTSDDVKFSYEELIKQGGSAAPGMSSIDEITCPDETTVVFKLKHIDSGFLGNLAYNGTFILPRHIYEGKDWLGNDSMMEPIGTGPFKFGSWDRGVKITLVRNENYYLGNGLPYVDKLVFSYIADSNTAMQSFYNGELDILGIIAPATENDRFLSDPNIKADKVIYPSRFYIGFNFAEEINQDINFRLAVAHATNSDDIINKALKSIGMKAETYMSPLYEWAVNDSKEARIPEYNLEKAKEYMSKTHLKPDANGVYAKLTIDTYNYEPFPDMIQVVKEQLSQIGIDVTINMLEYAAWDEKVNINKDYTITLTGGYQGPDAGALSQRVVTDGILNFLNYSNKEIDRLFEEGASLPTFEQRAPKYKEAQLQLAKDVPMVVISEWLGYLPYQSYMEGHPASAGIVDKTAFGEFTYLWINK